MKVNDKNIFMKPGKTNKEDRKNFIKFWVEFMKNVSDKKWSEQQVMLIDSQFYSAAQFYGSLEKTEEGKKTLKRILNFKRQQKN